MTKEECIERLTDIMYGYTVENDVIKFAIKALEQQPSQDCVSRQAVLDEIKSMSNTNPSYWATCDVIDREDLIDSIKDLPSVIPKGITVTDFADRCRECGKQKKGRGNEE